MPADVFEDHEVQALMDASPCLWWRAFIEVSVMCGLRVQEALRLHATDVCERTHSLRITSDPVDAFGDSEQITLRRWLPVHHERAVPVSAAVLRTITRLRSERPDDSHVFVPDWKLDQLWPHLSGSHLPSNVLTRGLRSAFCMVQRRARLLLARRREKFLEQTPWLMRPLKALRATAAARLVKNLGPTELAAQLGCASIKQVMHQHSVTVRWSS